MGKQQENEVMQLKFNGDHIAYFDDKQELLKVGDRLMDGSCGYLSVVYGGYSRCLLMQPNKGLFVCPGRGQAYTGSGNVCRLHCFSRLNDITRGIDTINNDKSSHWISVDEVRIFQSEKLNMKKALPLFLAAVFHDENKYATIDMMVLGTSISVIQVDDNDLFSAWDVTINGVFSPGLTGLSTYESIINFTNIEGEKQDDR